MQGRELLDMNEQGLARMDSSSLCHRSEAIRFRGLEKWVVPNAPIIFGRVTNFNLAGGGLRKTGTHHFFRVAGVYQIKFRFYEVVAGYLPLR